jgi:hypothetical protein
LKNRALYGFFSPTSKNKTFWDTISRGLVVDLFYAITNCHGWVKSSKNEVIVRLEPVQQPKRRSAQKQLCRKFTFPGARLPSGKWLVVEVGDEPS